MPVFRSRAIAFPTANLFPHRGFLCRLNSQISRFHMIEDLKEPLAHAGVTSYLVEEFWKG